MTGRTIVYLPNWLGDMVMAMPFLHALRAYEYGEIWGVGKSSAIHVYNGLNLFDRFVSIDDKGIIASLDRASRLKKVAFKRAIALPHSFRSAFFFYNLRIRERVGYARNKRGFMLNRKIKETDEKPQPMVEHYLKILDVLGGNRSLAAPVLLVTDDEEHKFDEKFTDIMRPYGVFIAGAEYGPSKRWPEEHFSQLADRIIETYGMKLYMLPGKGEERLAERIRQGVKNKDLIEIKSMNVRDLKVCLSRASFVVSNDTGPRHMAAALSTPTVALLGPMDDTYTDYPSSCTYEVSRDISCRPCNRKNCDRNHECMREILPDEVFEIVGRIVEKKGQDESGR
ncbi:MAG TPA: lipopolysaccharide heptosyltransferase II [Syntrophorhabdaceae bacterium]|nr:lipopolysaccharide heptosyltransferase II [Syntrophorhabdaceae bacterium]